MRALLDVTLDTAASNKLIADGSMGTELERLLGQLKPEASYFFASGDGRRSMLLVVDVPDEASIVAICEPFWLRLEANVNVRIAMNADDLREGLRRIAPA
ncbi:hypothetical protein AB0F71_07695 [Kitasatospora sp. NPDC028055]|uniref:hypothetical protein n=1 Tax=unclassified Kitasatospora TaxID=2633591 RepID=UPI0033DFC442